ncbi:hypothetical protein NDU88_006717 [Pleurodeles waltl]|uniref:Uncharacterized protein n=1 Tax=Pleurodeles waltl TaxID=8319 RepID=A0AAV7VRT4_PLEWA|nr:hypothetical protein NDU88_006717 [Pleurodeles waltl]
MPLGSVSTQRKEKEAPPGRIQQGDLTGPIPSGELVSPAKVSRISLSAGTEPMSSVRLPVASEPKMPPVVWASGAAFQGLPKATLQRRMLPVRTSLTSSWESGSCRLLLRTTRRHDPSPLRMCEPPTKVELQLLHCHRARLNLLGGEKCSRVDARLCPGGA